MIKTHHVDNNPIPLDCVAEDKPGNYCAASTTKSVQFRSTMKLHTMKYGTMVDDRTPGVIDGRATIYMLS